MNRQLQHLSVVTCAALMMLATACSDDKTPTVPLTQPSVAAAPPAAPVSPSYARGMTVLSGFDADTALRALARAESLKGDNALAIHLDTAVAWNRARIQPTLAAMKSFSTSLPRTVHDLSGTGSPPPIPDPMTFARPTIKNSATIINLFANSASISSIMTFTDATNGQTDLKWEVKNADGSYQMGPQTLTFTGTAQADQCFADILALHFPPRCDLIGYVEGYATVTLNPSCGVTVSGTALHTAWYQGVQPNLTINSSPGWSVSFTSRIGQIAYPVTNVAASKSSSPCPEKEVQHVEFNGDGGDFGGQYVIFPPNQPAVYRCFADEERTVQSDGSVGPWSIILSSISCGLYESRTAIDAGASQSKTSGGGTAVPVTTLPFTLATASSLPGKSQAQVVRRAKNAGDEPDVVALTKSSTADDLMAAVQSLIDANGNARSGRDEVTNIDSTRTNNSGKFGNQRRAYANLLGALRRAEQREVKGVGNTAAVSVLVIQ